METYYGNVKTPADAIKLFEACRMGMLPRVQRRLSEKERQAIRSGSVFVWDEREAGMRRWTDGKSWSASRVSGSFLTYREMEGKRSGFGGSGGRRTAGKTPDSGRGSDEDQDDGEPDGYRYKADGLMKQSFSITTSQGQHLHLISYFARGHNDLLVPSTDPHLRTVIPTKGLYPESNLNEPSVPAAVRAPMHQPMYGPPPPQPHPHQGYPPPYSQPPPPTYSQAGVAWPPSPVGTPPYSSGQYQNHPPQPYPPTLPPPQSHHTQAPPPLTYSHGPVHQYERLPPPQPASSLHPKPSMPLPQPYPTHSQSHSPRQQYQPYQHQHQHQPHQQQHQQQQQQPPPPPPQQQQQQQQQHIPSPHSSYSAPQRISPFDPQATEHLQAAAQKAVAAVMIDPQLAAHAGRSSNGPLPALGPQSQNLTSTLSPPPQTRSISPPGNQTPEEKGTNGPTAGNNKVSLSALIHPVSARSESGGPNPAVTGGNTSPRGHSGGSVNGPSPRNGREAMEARAIGALDKTICMT